VPQGKTAKYLIVNGAECEPFITSDHRLMLEKPEEILIGTKILMKAINVEKALIGIENNKIDAIQKLKKFSVGCEGIEIKALKVKYPQGAEKQLVHALTKKQIPSGGLPIDCGCVVHNVGTVFSVYEAVTKNKPVIERVVTVSGNSLKNPSNFRVRIGTSVLELINAAGGMPEDTEKILMGGPMMGKALKCVDIPVTKGTSAIVLISSKDARRKGYLNCIRCGKCVSICPLGLEPYLLMQLAEKQMHEKLEYEKVMNCCECGSCSYICPSNRPLLDYIRLGKFVIGNIIKSRIKINAK